MNEDAEFASDQLEAAERLADALNGGRFVLYRQRIEPVAADEPRRAFQEILVRFLDEDERRLHPGQFFATLERCGLMFTLDCWIVNSVITWLADRQKCAGGGIPCCSINLSADSLANPELPGLVRERLKSESLLPRSIVFEITEAECAAHAIALEEIISHLAPLGCCFAAAGYNGEHVTPALLQALGINFAKIEGAIIQSLHRNRSSLAMTREIVRLCRTYDIRTVAQCVELPETVEALQGMRVDYLQGYGIAVPEPLE